MAQGPVDHDAFAGMDDAVYQNGQQFNAFDNNFAYHGDQYPANNDANWPMNPAMLHSQQALSRGSSHSPVWPTQHQTQQPLSQHLLARQVSTGANHGDALRQQQSGHYAVPNAYNNYHNPYQFQPQHYDPSLLGEPTQAASQSYHGQPFNTHAAETHTIAPQSLQHEQPITAAPPVTFSGRAASHKLVDQKALVGAVPHSENIGLFNVIDFDKLVRATNSERLSHFATIGRESQEWAITRAALPAYVPRKSRNELKAAAGNDASLLAKISSSRKSKSKLRLAGKRTALIGPNGKPSAKLESVSGDSESDSETSDSDLDDSPLPSRRPDLPRDAIEYDTIKAVWRNKRKSVDAKDVRDGLVAFWDIVKTVRDRWKADAAAVTQAIEKGAKNELPFLRQRVKDQRDLIEVAFKTALKHGNRTILET